MSGCATDELSSGVIYEHSRTRAEPLLTAVLLQHSVSGVRGFAGLLLLAFVAGCSGAPGESASRVPTPLPTLAPGEIPLPTFLEEVDGQPQLCAGSWYEGDVRVHGSPDDPALTWIVFANDGHRENLLWPPGYRARFTPMLEVLDPFGRVYSREGDSAHDHCPMLPGGVYLDIPTASSSP